MNIQTDIESKLKAIFKKVLDIKESEIVPEAKLDEVIRDRFHRNGGNFRGDQKRAGHCA